MPSNRTRPIVAFWALAVSVWRFGRVEERWETSAAAARAEQA